ncbi:dnaJ homolog subfamily C member 17-like [Ctenopharyngodon idella]|uniref:dnaJ homolog subfamily C member 17-like n=1 Tax=Ctenopharyngodon idella TaxID=7959 RepID=UPI002230014C|nr:dnaJ homolog subfamily C member 17-like [Ctenopharyngodon idella]XP_051723719.1 dnaJ homolog subfamily C member 17-like [Ctenopharyngodon idella]
MTSTKELLEMDLYALLGVESTATEKQIKKAYRQRALSCHPDKNPDNPKAAELFHQLSQALEVLTDAAAKAAYDKVRAAKKQAEERNRKLDDKRKKIKLDLEARERQAETVKTEEIKITRTLEEEIARLREEGSRELQEQQRLIREQIQRETDTHTGRQGGSDVTPKLKLKWKCKKDDASNAGYSHDCLQNLFQKYGDVLNILISSKKRGSAVVEFASVKAADLAIKNEIGLTGNPLKITWLEGQPAPTSHIDNTESYSSQSCLRNERDYESVVLMRLRQAEERKRLIEEMKREEEQETA